MVFIVRKKLSASEIQPAGTRWNEDCNCVQTTTDDGETWTDNDGADPRKNPAFLLPANTTEDPRCNSAFGMSERVRSIVDAFVATGAIAAAATAIFGVISILFPPAAIVAAIVAFADFALAIGAIEIEALMTEDVYAALTCIFFCNMGDDGQVDDAQFAQIYTDIEAQIDEGAAGIVERCLDLIGFNGINNSGAINTVPGDCSDCTGCEETCHLYDPMVVDVDYVNSNDGVTLFGTYDTGFFDDDKTLVLTRVQATWTQAGGSGSVVAGGLHVTVYSADVYPAGHTFTANDTSGSASADIDTSGSGHVTRIIAQIFTQWSGGGPYSIYDTLQLDYEPVHSPFGWASGADCTP